MSPVRILVVDDFPVIRRGVRAIVEGHHAWQVCGETDNGIEAVQLARRLRPDIVVLDALLPRLSGVEAARRIIAERAHTEVLVFTAHAGEELIRDALEAGARGYLLKTESGDRLVKAIEHLRQHRLFLAPAISEFVLEGYLKGAEGAARSLRPKLTPREREVLQLVAEGKASKEAAAAMRVSVKTIDAHRASVMRKLRLRSISELVRYAIRNHLIRP